MTMMTRRMLSDDSGRGLQAVARTSRRKKQRKGEIIYKDRPGQDEGDLLEINQRSGACSLSLVLIL